MRPGRSSLILVSALMLACLTAFSALAQGRNNTPPRRPAPEAAPSGHQSEAVDLNEGKSPAELFQAGCAVCHQSAAGLAKGRRDSELAGFLRQHYTSGTQHAAALAGFLAAAGGGRAATGPARMSPNAPIDRPPAPIGSDRKPAQEAARPQEPREPAAKRKPPEKPPVAARVAPPAAPPGGAAATEAAAHPGDAPAAAPSAPPPPPVEEKPAPPEIPL